MPKFVLFLALFVAQGPSAFAQSKGNLFRCVQANTHKSLVIVIEEEIAPSLAAEIRQYRQDICRFQGYSSYLLTSPWGDTDYVERVLELQGRDSSVEGAFLIGELKSDAFLASNAVNQNFHNEARVNALSSKTMSWLLPPFASDQRLNLPRHILSQNSDGKYYIRFPFDPNALESMKFSARLPLGTPEALKAYFDKIHLARTGDLKFEKTVMLATQKSAFFDVAKLSIPLRARGYQVKPLVAASAIADWTGGFIQSVRQELEHNDSMAVLGFHGDPSDPMGAMAYSRWGFQSVLSGSMLKSNVRLLIAIACSIGKNEYENSFIYNALTSGKTLNVIAARANAVNNGSILSQSFIDLMVSRDALLGKAFTKFIDTAFKGDDKFEVATSLYNLELFHLYGDPLLPLMIGNSD